MPKPKARPRYSGLSDLTTTKVKAKAKPAKRERPLRARPPATPVKAEQASGRVTSAVEKVDPETAERWLGANSHNRSLRDAHVEALAGAIRRGEWHLNGDAIRWAEDGTLLDGQHRLWAVVVAETPIETLVIRGLDADTQATMDAGKRRTLSDALKLRGELDANSLAAAITFAWRYLNADVRGLARPTNAQALAFLDENPDIRDASIAVRSLRKRLHTPQSAAAAIHFAFARLDQEAADVFLEKLVDGTGLEKGSPILAFRNWLLRQSSSTGPTAAKTMSGVLYAAYAIKAWNAWREGRLIEKLTWKTAGRTPEAFPVPE